MDYFEIISKYFQRWGSRSAGPESCLPWQSKIAEKSLKNLRDSKKLRIYAECSVTFTNFAETTDFWFNSC